LNLKFLLVTVVRTILYEESSMGLLNAIPNIFRKTMLITQQ
jgi:hypothetical protein